jgi:hypothetical protein
MPKKATSKRRTTKARTRKPARKAPSQKPAKPSQPAEESEPLVVFAFRLTRTERNLIHKAAGPAKASKMVKAAALAAAKADVDAFRDVVAETKAAVK